MDAERTKEFILHAQARAEARADRAEQRMDRLERAVAQNTRLLRGLVRTGVSLRSDVRELQKYRVASEKFRVRMAQNMAEITDRLDALIDIVDKSIRGNGGRAR